MKSMRDQQSISEAASLKGVMTQSSSLLGNLRRKSVISRYLSSNHADAETMRQKNDIVTLLSSSNKIASNDQRGPGEHGLLSNEKVIYFGDIVYLAWNIRNFELNEETSGVLLGEKYANKFIQFKTNKSGLDRIDHSCCLFQIVNLSEKSQSVEITNKQKVNIKKMQGYSIGEQSKSIQLNHKNDNRLPLLYGQGFSLKHIESGMYLSLKKFNSNFNFVKGKDNFRQLFYRFELTAEENGDTYFKYYPINSYLQIGNPMKYEEPLFFKDEHLNQNYSIQLPDSMFEEGKLTLNSNDITEWRFFFYNTAEQTNENQKECLRSGDIIQIFDSETNEYLICKPEKFRSGNKALISFPHEMGGTFIATIEVDEIQQIDDQCFEVAFEPNSQNSVYSFWKVQLSQPFNNKPLTDNTQFQMLNLMTNTYLILEEDEGKFKIKSGSERYSHEIDTFMFQNNTTSSTPKPISLNLKYSINASIKFGQHTIDVLSTAFRDTKTESTDKLTKYSSLSIKKVQESSKKFLTMIELKYCLERLHEFFLAWGTKSEINGPLDSRNCDLKTNFYKFDHDFAAKTKYVYNQKLEEFKVCLQIVRNLLLHDFTEFEDFEEDSKHIKTIGECLSEQISAAHIISILVEILDVCVARFYRISWIIVSENKGTNSGDEYDSFLNLEKSLKLNDTRKKISVVEAMENYEKLIALILKFLAKFSYKDEHIQNCIIEKIDLFFPLLVFYRDAAKAILSNVLSNSTNPKVNYLRSLIIKKFMDTSGDFQVDAYFINVASMYNLIAKAIKHYDVPSNLYEMWDELVSKENTLATRIKQLTDNKSPTKNGSNDKKSKETKLPAIQNKIANALKSNQKHKQLNQESPAFNVGLDSEFDFSKHVDAYNRLLTNKNERVDSMNLANIGFEIKEKPKAVVAVLNEDLEKTRQRKSEIDTFKFIYENIWNNKILNLKKLVIMSQFESDANDRKANGNENQMNFEAPLRSNYENVVNEMTKERLLSSYEFKLDAITGIIISR